MLDWKILKKTGNYFVEEIEKNQLKGKKHKKFCMTIIYTEHFHILSSTITGCISIFNFVSLVSFPRGITSFAIGLHISAITAAIKSKIKIKTKKQDKIVLLGKTKLNNIEV